MSHKTEFSTVKKILLIQVVVVSSISAVLFYFVGLESSVSCFLGGIIAFLPNCYFAAKMRKMRNEKAKLIVRSFYSGEAKKILLTSALFALAFQYPSVQIIPLMAGFIAVISVFWFALILFTHDFEINNVRKDGK